jgi:hypothetical protein
MVNHQSAHATQGSRKSDVDVLLMTRSTYGHPGG